MHPSFICSATIDPLEGLPPFKARVLAKKASFPPQLYVRLGDIASQLYKLFVDKDAIVLEINPLALTEDGEIIAADGKMDMDEDALFRHPEWEKRPFDETDLEAKAQQKNLRFVELDGDIGVCGNGAGMMMTAMDLIVRSGGKPANFCEAGGRTPALDLEEERSNGGETPSYWSCPIPRVTRLLFNLVGGNQRGDEVAMGIVEALKNKNIPAFIRLSGTKQEEGRKILADHGYKSYDTLEESVQAMVQRKV